MEEDSDVINVSQWAISDVTGYETNMCGAVWEVIDHIVALFGHSENSWGCENDRVTNQLICLQAEQQ